jgi:hypothetical protein
MKFKLFTLLFISILLVGTISAFEFDNIKSDLSFTKNTKLNIGDKQIDYNPIWEKYKPIEIKNSFGLGKTLFSGAIDEHTESCGENCFSTMDINLAEDGSLIDDIDFYTIKDDGSRIEQDIRSYQFSYWGDIDDYEYQCYDTENLNKNGTKIQSCSNIKVGSHEDWINYNLGDSVLAGNYKIKLEGEKKPTRTIDWVIKTNGKWLNEWALWYSFSYDNYDSSVNTTLWDTSFSGSGTNHVATFSETSEYIQAYTWVDNDDGAGTNSVSSIIQTKEMNNTYNYNMSMRIYMSNQNTNHGDSSTSTFSVFGNTIKSITQSSPGTITNDTVWYFEKSGSSYNVYADGNFQSNFIPSATNNNITIISSAAEGNDDSAQKTMTTRIYPIYYSEYGIPITLNSPENNYISPTNSVDFNTTVSTTGGAVITNVSLWTNVTGAWEREKTKLMENRIYDEIDDSYLNTTLWGTSYTGTTATFTENTDYLQIFQAVQDNSGSSHLWSKELNSSNIGNIELKTYFKTSSNHDASGYSMRFRLYIFGNLIEDIYRRNDGSGHTTNESTWILQKNGANIDVYNNEIYQETITPIDDYINITLAASDTANRDREMTARLYYVNLTAPSISNDIFDLLITEPTLWGIQACDSDGDCGFSENRTLNIDTTNPTITINAPIGAQGSFAIGSNLSLNWTVTDTNLDSCWFDYNSVNTSVVCADNNYSFITIQDKQSLIFYANDTVGNSGSESTSWVYTLLQNNVTSNITTRETKSETFSINVSSQTSNLQSAILYYDGVNKGASSFTGNSSDSIFTNTIDIPTITTIENKSYYWNVTTSSGVIQTESNNIFVNEAILVLCNSTINNPYINFTFKNETTNQEDLSTSMSSGEFNYYIGSGTVNKTLFFSNSSLNPSYSFCLSPQSESITLGYSFSYTNTESQTRVTQDIISLNNATTNKVLYLLPSLLGLFSTFSVQDNLGNPISGVAALIERSIGASTVTVGDAITDSSGIVTFFLNPDVTHTGTFSKTGLPTNTFTFVPISETRIVRMGTVSDFGNGSVISVGTSYSINPTNQTLLNNTQYTFSFYVNTSQSLDFISMNITNSSGEQVVFESSTTSSIVSNIFNTGNNTKLVGTFIFTSGNETLTTNKVWLVGDYYEGDYSLFKQLTLYLTFGFKDIYKFIIVVISIIAILLFMTTGEVIDTSESKVAVATLMIWAWSFVGWLDTGVIINSANANVSALTQMSNQYGIAILSTGVGIFFIIRRIFQ